jgi:PAS domain S-box-containing protein
MRDQKRTKEQLISELTELRRRVAGLEASETECKPAGETPRGSAEQWQGTIDAIEDLVMIVDKDFRVVRANRATHQAFAGAKVLGAHCYELFHGTEGPIANCPCRQTLRSGAPSHCELCEQHLDGRWFDVRAHPIKDEHGTVQQIAHLVRDITERKLVEEDLIRLSNAVEVATDAISMMDLEGKIVSANDAAVRMQGVEGKSDLIGKSAFDSVAPEDRERALAAMQQVWEEGYAKQSEFQLINRDGRRIPVGASGALIKDADGKPIATVAVVRDITNRKRAEEEMKVKNSAMASSINAIAMADLEGNLTYVNPSFLSMWGYKNEEEVVGKPATEFWHVREQASAIVQVPFENQGWQGELAASRKDGSTFTVQLSASMVTDDAGKPICMMRSFIDATERKRMEEALRESEAQYRDIANSIPGLVYQVALKKDGSMSFPFMSEGYSPLSSVIRKQAKADPSLVFDILMPEDRDIVNQGVAESARTMKPWANEFRLKTKSGGTKWVRNSARPRLLPDDSILWNGVVTDITEQKQMEQQLRDYSENLEQMVEERTRELQDAEERYRSVFEHAGDAIIVVNAKGVIQAFNRQAEQMFGYKAKEVVGKEWQSLYPPDESGERRHVEYRVERRAKALMRQGFYHSGDMVSHAKKDGKPLPVETSGAVIKDGQGKVIGYSVIYRDITERKRLEKELADSEERHRSIFEHAGDAIVAFDTEGVIRGWNRRAEEMFGYDAEEVLGKHWEALAPPADSTTGRRIWSQMGQLTTELEGRGFYRGQELLLYTSKGHKPLLVDSSGAVIRDKQGKLTGFSAIFRDITERKRLEEEKEQHARDLEAKIKEVETARGELQEAQEKLVRTEKLAAIGELAGGVGHELRNPLGAIKNATYLLNMTFTEPEPVAKEALEILDKEMAKSEHILSSLLDFGRPRSPIQQMVSINHAAQEALFGVKVPEEVEVVRLLDKSLPAIVADGHQLGMVFGNIIANAVQAMPEGGKLVIKSEVLSPAWLAVSFADTGVGIPKENLDKLFEPLFTTRGNGVGLGLAVSKTLVEMHGGAIEVKSQVGKGSTFTIKLPTTDAKVQKPSRKHAPRAKTAKLT